MPASTIAVATWAFKRGTCHGNMPYNYLHAGFVWPWFVEILRREAEARSSDYVLRTRLELVQAFLPKGF